MLRCVCPLFKTTLSLTDLAEAVALRFASDMFTRTVWPVWFPESCSRSPEGPPPGKPVDTEKNRGHLEEWKHTSLTKEQICVLISIQTAQLRLLYSTGTARWQKAGEFNKWDAKIDKQWGEKGKDRSLYQTALLFAVSPFYVFIAMPHSTSWMCNTHTVNNTWRRNNRSTESVRDYCGNFTKSFQRDFADCLPGKLFFFFTSLRTSCTAFYFHFNLANKQRAIEINNEPHAWPK